VAAAPMLTPHSNHNPMRSQRMTTYIVIAMVLGIVVGTLLNKALADSGTAATVAGYIAIFSDVFLRLIKMIIAPLVFCTLVAGVAKMGKAETIGRVGLKAITWFVLASLVSLVIGMVLVNLFRPGDSLNLPLPDASASANLKTSSLSLKEFVAHLVPTSIVQAMAQNEILQIVTFSLFFGVAVTQIPGTGEIVKMIDKLAHVILRITDYVMRYAPIAVFAAIAATITTNGLGVLATYGVFMLQFYFGILVLWLVLILVGFALLQGGVFRLLGLIKEPILIAFSTSSSEAAYPKLMEQLEKYPVSDKIIGFILPMGYSFNLDGSMMYMTFASLFLAQAYGVEITFGQQIVLLLTLLVTSKGIAGVPRASLVVIAATVSSFGIPEAGILLLMGVDTFLDMARSATNVFGNSLATTVIAHWEHEEVAPAPDLLPVEPQPA
jgi:Na+/H+-dicarboxylate symporter